MIYKTEYKFSWFKLMAIVYEHHKISCIVRFYSSNNWYISSNIWINTYLVSIQILLAKYLS